MKSYFLYIVSSGKNGTLYIGVTNNIERRYYEHKNGLVAGFTDQYNVHRLVYFEQTNSIDAAIDREKQLKNWRRVWKTDLVNGSNPEWRDLGLEF